MRNGARSKIANETLFQIDAGNQVLIRFCDI
jgi:hypothetical protein